MFRIFSFSPIAPFSPIVIVALVALFLLIKFRNQGTPRGRVIVGLVLIGMGVITLGTTGLWTVPMDQEASRFMLVFHTVVGYIILISALFCHKKKDE